MKVGQRVRSQNDGQIGYIVETETGAVGVRLDRRGENRVLPYREAEWRADVEAPLTPLQVARICYGADRAYRMVHGEYEGQVPDWIALKDEQRHAFIKGLPPGASEGRRLLYQAVKGTVATS